MVNKRLMQQAQQLQDRLSKMHKTLEAETVQASAGGGAVAVVVTGKQRIQSITIDPVAVDPIDVEMLQDLVQAAVNEAMAKSQELAERHMSAITGGLKIPGLS